MGGGGTVSNKGCTVLRCVELGCVPPEGYLFNQLISSATKKVTLVAYSFKLNYGITTTIMGQAAGEVGQTTVKMSSFNLVLRNSVDNSTVQITNIPSNPSTVLVEANLSKTERGTWDLSFMAPSGGQYKVESCQTTWEYVNGLEGMFEVQEFLGDKMEAVTDNAKAITITETNNPILDYYNISFYWRVNGGISNYVNTVTFIANGGTIKSGYIPQFGNLAIGKWVANFEVTLTRKKNDGSLYQTIDFIKSGGYQEKFEKSWPFVASADGDCHWIIEMPCMEKDIETQLFSIQFPSWVDVAHLKWSKQIGDFGDFPFDQSTASTHTVLMGFLTDPVTDTNEYVLTLPLLSGKNSNANNLKISLISKKDAWSY